MPKTPGLRELRNQAALSQEELATVSGISRATIADLEAGNRGAWPKTVRQLAEALNVEPQDLYREPDYPKAEAPPLQPSFNHLLAEERRTPTNQEIKALNRHLAYVERRLDEDSMSRDEADDELDIFLAFVRMVRDTHSDELTDRYISLSQRVFDKAKELKARRVAAAEGVLEDMREWRAQRAS